MFHIFTRIKRDVVNGPSVRIDCPKCLTGSVPAKTETLEVVVLSWYILFTTRDYSCTHYFECGNCGRRFRTKESPEELSVLLPHEIESKLLDEVHFSDKMLAMTCIISFVMPLIGALLAFAGLLLTKRQKIWPRKVFLLCLIIYTPLGMWLINDERFLLFDNLW